MPQPSPIVVIAPDSFKGSLSAEQVANAIAAGVARARPDALVRRCPMADGGEGTLDALLAHGGTRRTLRVPGASLAPRDAAVGSSTRARRSYETDGNRRHHRNNFV